MPDSEQAKLSARTLKVLLEGMGKWPDGAEVYPICIGQGQGVDCDVLIKDGFAYVQELKEELQGGDPAVDELVEEFGKQVGYPDGMGDPTGNGSIVGTTAHIGEMDKLNQQFKKGWDELMAKQGMAATMQTLRNRHLPVSMKPSDGKPDGQPGGSVESKANAQARESGSLTPIASLARTADDLVDDLARRAAPAAAAPAHELVDDLHAAIRTLARRSDGLMPFVRSYREFTQMPPPTLRPIALDDYVARIATLFATDWAQRGIALTVSAPPAGIAVTADEALLDQAVINLLRNAADAAASAAAPQVWLDAGLSDRGRPIPEISDNGAGLDPALGDKIFLPFFTTKPEGSGIGLALARQVMLVHKGAITAGARPGGGALFRLTF